MILMQTQTSYIFGYRFCREQQDIILPYNYKLTYIPKTSKYHSYIVCIKRKSLRD